MNQSDVFDFVNILLKGEEVKFEEFWTSHDISKATALRHLKGVRDLIRSFDIRMYYDPIRLEGDENKIRLVLIILFWLATDGHTWPFETIDRLDALKAFDLAIERFQLAKPNVLTRIRCILSCDNVLSDCATALYSMTYRRNFIAVPSPQYD